MILLLTGIFARITSNSSLNVFQKKLTNLGYSPSVINFYTYLGLSSICILLIPFLKLCFSAEFFINFFTMGLLGCLGNYFIIKALSQGELSSVAPINSYKPIIAMIIAFLYLKEVPSILAIIGIFLIILGTILIYDSVKYNKTAVFYRVLALIFSGAEAVFIKKIILLTNIPTSFLLWSLSGLIFTCLFVNFKEKINPPVFKYQSLLVLLVAVMQYSTNFVFSKINVSYALALFQLSTLLSVFLGINIFHETGLKRKVISSLIMIAGAVVIILN